MHRALCSSLHACNSPTVLLYAGVDALVDSISNNAGVRLGVWAVVSAVVLEVPDLLWVLFSDPAHIKNKAPHWLSQVTVWSAALVYTGGNLGLYFVAVTFVALVLGDLIYLAIFGDPSGGDRAGTLALTVTLVAACTIAVGCLVV